LEVPCHDKPVAAVVAGATQDKDPLPFRVEANKEFGGPAPGVLHEDDAGDAVLVDRPPVQLADGGAGQGEGGHGAKR
jgi:hypothetical protein